MPETPNEVYIAFHHSTTKMPFESYFSLYEPECLENPTTVEHCFHPNFNRIVDRIPHGNFEFSTSSKGKNFWYARGIGNSTENGFLVNWLSDFIIRKRDEQKTVILTGKNWVHLIQV